jgi:putative endonuclease
MSIGKGGCVYILSNKSHTVLYTGVTSDLYSRMIQHIEKHFKNSFTSKYNCTKLLYYMPFHSIEEAILQEKKIKGGSRQGKIDLINSLNPGWVDLWEEVSKW